MLWKQHAAEWLSISKFRRPRGQWTLTFVFSALVRTSAQRAPQICLRTANPLHRCHRCPKAALKLGSEPPARSETLESRCSKLLFEDARLCNAYFCCASLCSTLPHASIGSHKLFCPCVARARCVLRRPELPTTPQ